MVVRTTIEVPSDGVPSNEREGGTEGGREERERKRGKPILDC